MIQPIMPIASRILSRRVELLFAALLSVTAIPAAAAEQVTIARLSGSVQISEDGKSVAPSLGIKLSLPLRVITGSDGNVRLEHMDAALDVGPDSVVVIPRVAQGGSALEKIRQQLGRVLYSVKPRQSRPLVVETPYLVSVVKGTTFSVAVDERSASVALLEGSLQISGDGVDQTVLLAPNQTATRDRDARTISVTTIETSAPLLSPQAAVPSSLPAAPLGFDQTSPINAQALQAQDLSEITAAYVSRTTPAPAPPTLPDPQPDQPSTQPQPSPEPQPSPPAEPEPVPPSLPPAPQPEPPMPEPDDDHHDNENDDDDDGNNGHGNDEDGRDNGNPGNSGR